MLNSATNRTTDVLADRKANRFLVRRFVLGARQPSRKAVRSVYGVKWTIEFRRRLKQLRDAAPSLLARYRNRDSSRVV